MKSIVLMYHCVYENHPTESGFQNSGANIYKISVYQFEEQIKSIIEYCNSNLIDISHINFTFDDGGVSSISIIAPILEQYGLKGFFFIATQYIGITGFLTTSQILELHKRGHVIGSHSHSHPEDMTRLSETEINNEWRKSVRILSEIIGSKVEVASIPNGFFSNKIIKTLEYNGVKSLYTSKPDCNQLIVRNMSIYGRYAVRNNMLPEDILLIIKSNNARLKIYYKYIFLCLVKKIMGKSYFKIREMILKK